MEQEGALPVNAETLRLIKSHEGLRLQAYPDPAHGWSVPTIGYGHTSAGGAPKVTKGMSITEAQADEILRQDLASVVRQVERLVAVPLNENQKGALVSFTFNLGAGNLSSSTLLRKLNAGDYIGAAGEFERWVHGAGKVMPGLVKRRKDERALFLKPIYQSSPPRPSAHSGEAPRSFAPAIFIILAVIAVIFFALNR